jgi:chemotaxis signal transduction protein
MPMNNDAITTTNPNSSLCQEALEKNLIAALTRLQHTAFEKELLGSSVPLAADAKPESFFGFYIGAYHFMVAASCFCEVLVDTAIASIPNAPSCLVGLSNVRGVLTPIYQIHSSLNIDPPKKWIIFLVGKGESAVGILIDSLPTSLSASVYQRQTANTHEQLLLQQLVQAHYFINQEHWLLFSGTALGSQLLALANQFHKAPGCLPAGGESAYV